jgi:hypothetical protein
MSWTLANLRARFRTLTGRGSVNDITDADCNTYINEYLQYRFPVDVQLDRFDDDYTQEMTATDTGEYALSEDILDFQGPIFANDDEIAVYYDKELFWRTFPSEEDWITAPTLEIGVSNAAAVANAAFKYMGQDGRVRSKAVSETALSGDEVPVNKYGAWLLEINDDGTIAVQEADDNAAGYDSAALAIDGLSGASSGCIVLGFVTAINTAGAFVPGTTLLSAAGVTDTYTDGHPGYRGQPVAVLVNRSRGKLYVRPRPDDFYILKSLASLTRPMALSDDSDTLLDEAWGPAVAIGAAIDYLNSQAGEDEQIALLHHGGDRHSVMSPGPGSLCAELERITLKEARQVSGRQIRRAW